MINKIRNWLVRPPVEKSKVELKEKSAITTTYRLIDQLFARPEELTDEYRDIPVIHAGVEFLATTASQAPMMFKDVNSGQKLNFRHPVVQLFKAPNKTMSDVELIEHYVSWMFLAGECFFYFPDGGQNLLPSIIEVVNPKKMMEDADKAGNIKGWKFNGKVYLPEDKITHIKNFNTEGLRGLSVTKVGKLDMEYDNFAARYIKNFFKNGAQPSLVLKVEGSKEEAMALLDAWNTSHQGVENSHKVGVLLNGELQTISMTHEEMAYFEGRREARDSMLLLLRLNKAVMGVTDKVDRATAEVSELQTWKNTIRPILNKLASRLNADFFPIYAPNVYCEFDYSNIEALHQNIPQRAEVASKLFLSGLATRRQLAEKYPEIIQIDAADEEADLYFVPNTNKPLPTPVVPEPAREDEAVEEEKTQNELIDKLLDEFLLEQKQMLDKSLKKTEDLRDRTVETFYTDVRSFMKQQRRKIMPLFNKKAMFDPSVITVELSELFRSEDTRLEIRTKPMLETAAEEAVAAASQIVEYDGYKISKKIIENRLNNIKQINDTTYAGLKELISDAMGNNQTLQELSREVSRYLNIREKDAIKIARTEANGLISQAQHEYYKDSGVENKIWIANDDARDSHRANADAGAIPMDQAFPSGQQYPGDPAGGAENCVNCRCSLAVDIT